MQRSTSLFSDWISYRQYLMKLTIQVLNLFYLVSGILLLSISSIFISNYYLYLTNFSASLLALALLSGILLTFISILGCCGSIKESPCMLLTYSILLLIVFVIQLISALIIYLQKDVIYKNLVSSLYSAIKIYEVGNENSQMPLDLLQENLQCCGIESYHDWISGITFKHSPWEKYVQLYKMSSQIGLLGDDGTNDFDTLYLPDSCCKNSKIQFCGMSTSLQFINKQGCSEKLKISVNKNVETIGSLAIFGSILNLVGICLSSFLWNKIRSGSVYNAMQTSLEHLANKNRQVDKRIQLKIEKTRRREILTTTRGNAGQFDPNLAAKQIHRDVCTSAKHNRISQARPSIPMMEKEVKNTSQSSGTGQRRSYQKKPVGKTHSSGHKKLAGRNSSSAGGKSHGSRKIASKKSRQGKD